MTPLVSKKVLLRYTQIQPGDTRFDDVLESLVESVSEVVQLYLGACLERSALVELLPSRQVPEGSFLYVWLKAAPVVDDQIPLVVSYRDSVGGYQRLEERYYTVLKQEAVVVLQAFGGFSENPVGLKVEYFGGYPSTVGMKWNYLEVPTAIATATAIQTAYLFNLYSRGSFGIETVTGDDAKAKKTVSIRSGEVSLIPECQALLNLFRRNSGLVG